MRQKFHNAPASFPTLHALATPNDAKNRRGNHKTEKNVQCEINLQKRAQGKKTRTPNVMSESWSTCLQRGRRGPVLTKCRTSHHCCEHGRTYTILTQTVAGEINLIPFIFSMCQLLLTSHLCMSKFNQYRGTRYV